MAVCGDEINPLRLESKRLPFLPLHVDFWVWDMGKIPICMRYTDQDKCCYSSR